MFFKAWASLRLTAVFLVLLLLGAVIGQYLPEIRVLALALPLVLLAANLLAAIAFTASFRRQLSLLVFHIALLSVVVLTALSVLTSMTGTAEIAEGQWFDGHMISQSAGPLHPGRMDDLAFALESVQFGFRADGSVEWMRASVLLREADGQLLRLPLSVQRPVHLSGYRIYATPARGFAAVITWKPDGALDAATGAVHFPPVPADPYRLTTEWEPPGGTLALWMQVSLPAGPLPSAEADWVRPPDDVALIIREQDGRRVILKKGESTRIAGGDLRFDEVRWWLGLSFHYDWTVPWLLAASIMAVLSLGGHFAAKFRGTSWDA